MKAAGRNDSLENGHNNNNNNNNNNTRNGGYSKKCQPEYLDDTTTVATVPFCLPKKLQVTEKDGSFIALDNNSLKLMRQLERLGHCTEVEVEIVPLSKVPPNVVQEMAMGGGRQSQQYQQSRRNVDEEENVGQNSENTTKKHCRMRCRAAQAQRRLSTKITGSKGAPSEHRYLCSQHSHCCTERKEHRQEGAVLKSSTELHQSPAEAAVGNTELTTISSSTSTITMSSTTGTNTATTSSTTTSFSLNGFNTYLSDQQLRTARMSNTMTVMAPCLRQPITTSTPTSDLAMRQFKWHFCCAERQHHGSSGKGGTCCSLSAATTNKSVNSGEHHLHPQCQSDMSCHCNGDPSSVEDAESAKAKSASLGQQQCCLNGGNTNILQSSAPTSSHHHCFQYKAATTTQSCHCHAASCEAHSNKSNCLNNNCSQMKEDCQEPDTDEDDDEEELSSDNDEEGDDAKCNSNGEEEEESEEEDDNEESDEDEDDEEDDEEDEEEDEENLNCTANSFPMRPLHHHHHRNGSLMTDDEDEEDDCEESQKRNEEEDGMGSCLREMEFFACNVCDRTYRTARCLAKHQVHRRHFGCSICDTVFPTLLSLEQHKHTLEHWSEDEDDDHSAVSLSLNGSTSRPYCSETGVSQQPRNNNNNNNTINSSSTSTSSIIRQHNHPVISSTGYPSDALHQHNHRLHQHNSRQRLGATEQRVVRPGGAQKDERGLQEDKQTKLSLQSTTIAGQLEGKWSPTLNFGSHNLGAPASTGLNCISSSSIGNRANTGGNITRRTSAEQLNANIDVRCRTTPRAAKPAAVSTSKPAPAPLSSLSSKLMASVFNFSSAVSTDLEAINSKSSGRSSGRKGDKGQLNTSAHQHSARLSRSAEEMESLL